MDIEANALTLRHKLSLWWREARGNSLYCWLAHLIPSLIVWNIWIARDKSKFEEIPMNASSVIEKVKSQICDIYFAHNLQLVKGKFSMDCMNFFKLPIIFKTVEFRLVFLWKKPDPYVIKLNVDGARKSNPGEDGIGGLFRDQHVTLFWDFPHLGLASSIFAEAKAIWLGLFYANQLVLKKIG